MGQDCRSLAGRAGLRGFYRDPGFQDSLLLHAPPELSPEVPMCDSE